MYEVHLCSFCSLRAPPIKGAVRVGPQRADVVGDTCKFGETRMGSVRDDSPTCGSAPHHNRDLLCMMQPAKCVRPHYLYTVVCEWLVRRLLPGTRQGRVFEFEFGMRLASSHRAGGCTVGTVVSDGPYLMCRLHETEGLAVGTWF
jgi:hypothetical protein